ncbi:MAG: MBOAT family protein, partial [Leptospiraceae bacterium]|nr:MBOAT family protein [Leptospiraceae bacterium]
TMTLGGFWHGANIAYILWGFYLGVILWFERIFYKKNQSNQVLSASIRVVKIFFTFTMFSISGIFFRTGALGSQSLAVLWEYIVHLFTFGSGKTLYRLEELTAYIIFTLILNGIEYSSKTLLSARLKSFWIPVYAVLVMLLMGIFGDGGGDFIYFQF